MTSLSAALLSLVVGPAAAQTLSVPAVPAALIPAPAAPAIDAARPGLDAPVELEGLRSLAAAPESAETERPDSGQALRDFLWSEKIVPSAYAALATSAGGIKNALHTLRALFTSQLRSTPSATSCRRATRASRRCTPSARFSKCATAAPAAIPTPGSWPPRAFRV